MGMLSESMAGNARNRNAMAGGNYCDYRNRTMYRSIFSVLVSSTNESETTNGAARAERGDCLCESRRRICECLFSICESSATTADLHNSRRIYDPLSIVRLLFRHLWSYVWFNTDDCGASR